MRKLKKDRVSDKAMFSTGKKKKAVTVKKNPHKSGKKGQKNTNPERTRNESVTSVIKI